MFARSGARFCENESAENSFGSNEGLVLEIECSKIRFNYSSSSGSDTISTMALPIILPGCEVAWATMGAKMARET